MLAVCPPLGELGGRGLPVLLGPADEAVGLAGEDVRAGAVFDVSWNLLPGAATGRVAWPLCSTFASFCLGAASGSSDRLLTPAAALFAVNLKRFASPVDCRTGGLGRAPLGCIDPGVVDFSPIEESRELKDCRVVSVLSHRIRSTPFSYRHSLAALSPPESAREDAHSKRQRGRQKSRCSLRNHLLRIESISRLEGDAAALCLDGKSGRDGCCQPAVPPNATACVSSPSPDLLSAIHSAGTPPTPRFAEFLVPLHSNRGIRLHLTSFLRSRLPSPRT